jgi:uncharacterized protein
MKDCCRAIALHNKPKWHCTRDNAQYADLPRDFADLSLIAISERLNIAAIATLDNDFDIYRRYRNRVFERVFPPANNE